MDNISGDFFDISSILGGGFDSFGDMNEVSGNIVESVDKIIDQINEIENKTKDLKNLNLNDKISELDENFV